MRAEAAGTVSVVIPVFRAEAYVEQAVRSALEQAEVLEVLLVEDGSPDGSLATCRRLAEALSDRVRLLRHPDGGNHGAGASRNLGVAHAAGKYAAFLDADDYYLPGRFATSVPMLEAEPALDGIYEAVGMTFESPEAEREWAVSGGQRLVTAAQPPSAEGLAAALILGGESLFCTDGIVVRREVFEKVGGFDERLALGQDRAMWWKMALVCRLVPGNSRSPVAVYRRHGINRATATDPEFLEAGPRLALAVYRWAKARRLNRAQIGLVRAGLTCELLHCPDPQMSRAALRWLQLRRLAGYLLRCPSLLVEPHLWRRAFEALPGGGA